MCLVRLLLLLLFLLLLAFFEGLSLSSLPGWKGGRR